MKGYLWYNKENERYGIVYADCWADDGLHCGACMDVKINGKWTPVRLEYSNSEKHKLTRGWYLCNSNGALKNQPKLDGLDVRL